MAEAEAVTSLRRACAAPFKGTASAGLAKRVAAGMGTYLVNDTIVQCVSVSLDVKRSKRGFLLLGIM